MDYSVLLYKAGHIVAHDTEARLHRAHVESDFKAVLWCLTLEERSWLWTALRQLCIDHP